MSIELQMDLKISPNALKSIIIEYLDKLGYEADVDDVNFIVGTRYEGYGLNETPVHYFERAVVTVKGETK